MRIAAIYMPKGGAGKTFLTQHLAAGLALAGRRVLAIDADPGQGHLTLRMQGLARRGDLLRLLRDGASDALVQRHPQYPGLEVITTDPQDVDQFGSLFSSSGPYWPWLLRDRLRPWIEDRRYDYLLLDTGPGFESPVTTCAIQAATEMWLPYAVEYESLDSYTTLVQQLLPKARKVPEEFVRLVVPNKLVLGRRRATGDAVGEAEERLVELASAARTNDSVALLAEMRRRFGARLTPPVRLAESLGQRSAGEGRLIWEIAPEAAIAHDLAFVVEQIVAGEGAQGE